MSSCSTSCSTVSPFPRRPEGRRLEAARLPNPCAPIRRPRFCGGAGKGARGRGPSRAGALRLLRSTLAALLIAGGLLPAARGQSGYTVELIVFERLGDAHLDDEVWLADPGRPPIDEATALTGASRPFRVLDPSRYRLGGVFDRLRASRDYRPLLHVAWLQPAFSRTRARDARIQSWRDAQSGTPLPFPRAGALPAIDGTVQIYRRRFLHLRADLLYWREGSGHRPDAGAASAPLPSSEPARAQESEGDATQGSETLAGAGASAAITVSPLPEGRSIGAGADPNLARDPTRTPGAAPAGEHRGVVSTGPPEAFRMTARRRMRPGELHYLDHPLFGVLVIVSRS